MRDREFRLFALEASRSFGEEVAQALGTELSAHEERSFEDGEHKSRPLVSVREKDVFVVQSLYSDERQSVNDKLCRLLFFIGALRAHPYRRLHRRIAGLSLWQPRACYKPNGNVSGASVPASGPSAFNGPAPRTLWRQ